VAYPVPKHIILFVELKRDQCWDEWVGFWAQWETLSVGPKSKARILKKKTVNSRFDKARPLLTA
jgi:hypothetical protein